MATSVLAPAVAAAVAQRTQTRSFRANGNLTVPADVYVLDLLLVSGGGGGGGGYQAALAIGGGGGSGWPIRCQQAVQPGDVVALNVGAGGAGGAGLSGTTGVASPGANGGDTFVTVNGVETIRIPGGGGGGASASSNAVPTIYGRSSWGNYGAAGGGAAPFGGGGGAGYSGGISGPLRGDVDNVAKSYATGVERVKGGRRSIWLNNKLQHVGSTNGYPAEYDYGTLNIEMTLLVPERFLHICWGGTVAADALAPAAQPANSGHGGTGAGAGATVAANTGGNGGSGFVLVQYATAL